MSESPPPRPAGVVTRARHYACIHPQTYKYFLPRAQVAATWRRLAQRYGEASTQGSFGVMEIRHRCLLLRATLGGNPITVIRTRHCRAEHIEELHALLRYCEG